MGFLYSQFFVTPKLPKRSFAGETIIVTGSNIGLGKEAARHIASLGVGKLILAVRSIQKGEEAKRDIVNTTKVDASTIEVWQLDLGSFESVKDFAKRASALPRIDVLLENAGIAAEKFQLMEGHESTVTVNVISTFLLAFLMVPKLKEVSKQYNIQPRLVIVSSEVHGYTDLPERKADKIFEELDVQSRADMGSRYPVSKLLEVLVVREIAPKLEGTGVIMNMLNPGLCHSGLSRDYTGLFSYFFEFMKFCIARRTDVGARTLVCSAAAGGESHGKYMHDGLVNEGEVSKFVKSEEGVKTRQRVWAELKDILNKIEPGVTGNL
ncbi:hypothetical protein PMZ80_010953 [Knufia obscura]|uniref:Uncharacterized protein n=2 Tax=Knufia TaxID=430999 RepID=A0AAN8I3Z2_9EURO|nr:hypothetical protein PMZ80_010953 [Knufia obscura]KAK5948846.1 hypothetical protein OHC33_010097 [Knufia fluminis]